MFTPDLIRLYPEAKIVLDRRLTATWYAFWSKNILPLWPLSHFDREYCTTFILGHRMQDMYMRGNSRRNAAQIYVEHNAVVRGMMGIGKAIYWRSSWGWLGAAVCVFGRGCA